MHAATAPATSTDTYRRAARRLRCRLANDPVRLQRSLRALSRRPSSAFAPDEPPSAPTRHAPSGAAQRFAEHLAAHVPPTGVLRYSERLDLLRTARRHGIARFEANLLIAAVLDRRLRDASRQTGAGEEVSATCLAATPDWIGGLVAFALVQGALAAGAWWTLFR